MPRCLLDLCAHVQRMNDSRPLAEGRFHEQTSRRSTSRRNRLSTMRGAPFTKLKTRQQDLFLIVAARRREADASARTGGHEAAAALFLRTYPLRQDEITARPEQQRFASTDDEGRLVAYAALWPFRQDGYRFDLIVAPERRRQGIGDDLLRRLGELAARRARSPCRPGSTTPGPSRAPSCSPGSSRDDAHAPSGPATRRRHCRTGAEARLAATGIHDHHARRRNPPDPACWPGSATSAMRERRLARSRPPPRPRPHSTTPTPPPSRRGSAQWRRGLLPRRPRR